MGSGQEQLQALLRIASILAAPGHFRDGARQMLEVVREAVHADRVVLRIYDVVTGDMVPLESADPLLRDHPPVTVSSARGAADSIWALEHNEVVIVSDHEHRAHRDRRRSTAGIRSSVAVPIASGETPVGVLDVGSRRTNFFSPQAVEVLTAVAASLGALIELGRVRESLEVEKFIRGRIDNFVSIASHELRTPMTTLVGYSELLLTNEPPAEVRRQWFQMINAESRRLTEILDDFLDIARITAGDPQLNLQGVALPPLAAEMIAAPGFGSPDHQIEVEPGEDIPRVVADPDKVRQVLGNLLDNAIKYSPGGGRISVSFKVDSRRGWVVTSVSDAGIGIAPRDRSRLFEMFQRVRSEETSTIRGTGVGLHVVKSLVEAMGGEVWVRSRRHHGSTFSFALVAQQAPSGTPQAPEPHQERRLPHRAGQ
ncbi:MAG: GAF domain-containing sensor histidine kinase [Chloroflexi bacterium]|nr:GAF domain-containing sensor histidine kinase [Chloroflexota bacterium]